MTITSRDQQIRGRNSYTFDEFLDRRANQDWYKDDPFLKKALKNMQARNMNRYIMNCRIFLRLFRPDGTRLQKVQQGLNPVRICFNLMPSITALTVSSDHWKRISWKKKCLGRAFFQAACRPGKVS